jgi:solute carrier family 20 (sodium-dependent phosphate transporter)
MVYSEYTWIFVCSIFLALFVAWGIGANDVANAFGTSVGAKALTMKQAIIIASICEFGGAVLLGAGVTDTIKSGIADLNYYTATPDLLMYGMLCALLATGLWLALATFLELPVSTTHSIVGAIIGMSLIARGPDSVIWTTGPTAGSPFPGGVVAIILAWFITPAMAAVVAALLFLFTKLVVLKARDPFKRSLMLFPLYTFITVWVVVYFVIQKGVNSWLKSKTYNTTNTVGATPYDYPGCTPQASTTKAMTNKTSGDEITFSLTGCAVQDGPNAWISTVCAAGVTAICIICLKYVIKLVEHDVANDEAADEAKLKAKEAAAAGIVEGGGKDGEGVAAGEEDPNGASTSNRTPAMLQAMRKSKVWTTLSTGANYDIHQSIENDEELMAMHNEAELFDRKTEYSFKYLQVLTACANSFAHGANDVANSIGSMAAIYAIWQCSCATSKAAVPIWMFVLGGVGLILGLATYGYKIMRALGVKMTKLSNSRGYCAELTSAIIVIVSSRYGFPVSTTQVITGAITGIGLLEVIAAKMNGQKNAASRFNFKLLLKFFAGWAATLFVAGVTSAAFTAQGVYAPNRWGSDDTFAQGGQINATNTALAASFSQRSALEPNNAELASQAAALEASTQQYVTNPILDITDPLDVLINATAYLNNTALP